MAVRASASGSGTRMRFSRRRTMASSRSCGRFVAPTRRTRGAAAAAAAALAPKRTPRRHIVLRDGERRGADVAERHLRQTWMVARTSLATPNMLPRTPSRIRAVTGAVRGA